MPEVVVVEPHVALLGFSQQLQGLLVDNDLRCSDFLAHGGVARCAALLALRRTKARALTHAFLRARTVTHEAVLLDQHRVSEELAPALERHLAERVAGWVWVRQADEKVRVVVDAAWDDLDDAKSL